MMILIDSNSICHQAKHSMINFSWEEKEVGVIFGFFRQLLSLAKIFDSNKFVFVWDSRKGSIRTNMFPDYKKTRKREKTEEEQKFDDITYAQFNVIRDELLPEIGFVNNFMFEGYEGDDLVARITKTYTNEEIVIVSSDEDLYQLLSKNVSIYSIKKKQLYKDLNLWKDYRIVPKEWAEVKAIGGCTTDCVPGIPHVGEITACKYITKKLSRNHRTFQAIKDGTDIIERNRKLVTLPLEGTPTIKLNSNEQLLVKKFIAVSQRYGFNSFINKEGLAQWKEFVFKGDLF
jgi:DNA polymerase-1